MNLLDQKERSWDHWWPLAAQRFWEADDGTIGIKTHTKSERKKRQKKKIGRRRAGHFVDLGDSPWTHSFELVFREVDNDLYGVFEEALDAVSMAEPTAMPKLLRWLSDKNSMPEFSDRLIPLDISERLIDNLIRSVLSVVIRSPKFRYEKSFGNPKFGVGFEPGLGTTNIYQNWGFVEEVVDFNTLSPTLVFFRGPVASEFCFGDGFFDTLTKSLGRYRPNGIDWVPDLRGVVIYPLAPDVTVMVIVPTSVFSSRAFVLDVSRNEYSDLCDLTRYSSLNELFFRTVQPNDLMEIKKDSTMRVHIEPWSWLAKLQSFLQQAQAGEIGVNSQ